jgi:hypothetical protein
MQPESAAGRIKKVFRMSFLSILTMILSFVAGLFAVRELKILCEGDVERFQVVRAVALVTMTITPYIMPDPWSGITVIAGSLALAVSFFLEPKRS